MAFVGMMEGMQIALFACVNMPAEELRARSSLAAANCELCFTGTNLGAFLIGRQICVTCCMFIVARITTLNIDTSVGDATVFGVSDGIQTFFNTGLLGAVITTIVASLAWRIIASSFPVAFLSNPLIYFILRLCMLLEASGICSSAWLLALIHKSIVGYQLDEVYIGTKEERAAAKKGNDDLDFEEVDA
jgi:Silicon transporter